MKIDLQRRIGYTMILTRLSPASTTRPEMRSCGECGAPLLADVWSQVRVLRPCKSAFGLASMSRGHTGI